MQDKWQKVPGYDERLLNLFFPFLPNSLANQARKELDQKAKSRAQRLVSVNSQAPPHLLDPTRANLGVEGVAGRVTETRKVLSSHIIPPITYIPRKSRHLSALDD